jgi:hypothetical protein
MLGAGEPAPASPAPWSGPRGGAPAWGYPPPIEAPAGYPAYRWGPGPAPGYGVAPYRGYPAPGGYGR